MKKMFPALLALLLTFGCLAAQAEGPAAVTPVPMLTPVPAPYEAPSAWDTFIADAKESVGEWTAQTGSLHVTGSAAVQAVPDQASISVGVSETAPEVGEAQRLVSSKVNAILQAVRQLGVEENKIATSNYSIYPQSEYSSLTGMTELVGYRVSNTVTIHLDDFDLLEQVIDETVKAGANEMYGIEFDVSTRSDLYRRALEDAVRAANEKASLLAAASGVEIVAVTEISESGGIGASGGYGYRNSVDMLTSAAADAKASIEGGELSVSAQVEITYMIRNR